MYPTHLTSTKEKMVAQFLYQETLNPVTTKHSKQRDRMKAWGKVKGYEKFLDKQAENTKREEWKVMLPLDIRQKQKKPRNKSKN